ncbi:hypothetical protein ACLBR5_21285 [Escherichia coli]
MDNVVVTLDRHGSYLFRPLSRARWMKLYTTGALSRALVLLEAFGGGFTWGSALVRF